jgi:FkbM family methyltransferase
MKWLEKYKLRLRANKYKTKDDIGGVAYLYQTIKPGQTVLDIGAHKGGYLFIMLGLVGKTGKVVAFEPQSRLFNYISKMKRLLNWDNVTIEHIALADKEAETTLFIPTNSVSKKSAPGATIVNYGERNDIGFTENVSTDSIDHYCSTHNIAPDFIKIDVEGSEMNVFKGAINTLTKYKPRIIAEVDKSFVGEANVLETVAFLKGLGYNVSFINQTERVPFESFDFARHQNRDSGNFYCNNLIFE